MSSEPTKVEPTYVYATPKFVTPTWVYERPRYAGADVRYTPYNGKFRDADWAEPHRFIPEDSCAVTANGGIVSRMETPVRVFENGAYVKWTRNPVKPSFLLRLLSFIKPYPYWIPKV